MPLGAAPDRDYREMAGAMTDDREELANIIEQATAYSVRGSGVIVGHSVSAAEQILKSDWLARRDAATRAELDWANQCIEQAICILETGSALDPEATLGRLMEHLDGWPDSVRAAVLESTEGKI